MAHREEEKRRRREERQAAEQAAAAQTARRRRLQLIGGALLAVAAVVLVVIAVAGSGGGGGPNKTASTSNTQTNGVKIPPAKISDLNKAAAAAGCVVHDYPSYGQDHTNATVTYKTNPPTSGPHNPVPASDGFYAPGNSPPKEHFTHSLEHGRVEIQYRPGTPAGEIKQLQVLFNEPLASKTGEKSPQAGYKKLLFENNTAMPYAVAATAWQHLIGCPTFNPRIFDAIRDFTVKYVDTAPESQAIPFPE